LYPIYQAKADNQLIQEFESEGRLKDSEKLLKEMLKTKDDPKFGLSYAFALSFTRKKEGKNPEKELKEYYKYMLSKKDTLPDIPPSILFIIGAYYASIGDFHNSHEMNERILKEYPNFFEKIELKRYIANVHFEENRKKIPSYYIEILGSDYATRTDNKFILDDILADFREIQDNKERIKYGESLLATQKDIHKNPELVGLVKFNKAEALNNLDKFEESIELIESYIKTLKEGSYVHLNSLLLESESYRESGEIEKGQEKLLEFIKFYNFDSGIEIDPLRFEESLEYFETKARVFEIEKKFKEAALTYKANDEFLSLANEKKLPIQKLIARYGTYYHKKFVDTVVKLARSIREEEENSLLNKINIADQLDVQGRSTETLAWFFRWKYLRIFGDFRDFQYINYLDNDSLEIAENYYTTNHSKAIDTLDLAKIYGYAYYLISKTVLEEENFKSENNLTDARKKRILKNLKQAEYELLWVIYSDPDYVDAYLLLGWLYQYIEVRKAQPTFPENKPEFEVFFTRYIQTFPR
ncbi:MAG: hypothetical protein KDK36_03660, partial [Leptospiraceae bacterium]|nr:hypothetical protein [Leptospiraceae bacterium]